jgi:hypothetical protein
MIVLPLKVALTKIEIVIMETNVYLTLAIWIRDVYMKLFLLKITMLVLMIAVLVMEESLILRLNAMMSQNVLMTLVIQIQDAFTNLFLAMITISVPTTPAYLALVVLIKK